MATTTQGRKAETPALPVPSDVEITPLIVPLKPGEPEPTSIKPPLIEGEGGERTLEYRWRFAEETHGYIREFIRQADQKAVFFFAATTALLAFLYRVDLVHSWIKLPKEWGFFDFLSFFATFGLAVSALLFLWTVFPRLGGSRRGIMFFRAIAECESSRAYLEDISRCNVNELLSSKLAHVYELARICTRKHSSLVAGLWAASIGIAATVLLLMFSQ